MADPYEDYVLPLGVRRVLRGAAGVAFETLPGIINLPNTVRRALGDTSPPGPIERSTIALEEFLNRFIGAQPQDPLDNPGGFALELLGGGVVGLPRNAARAIGSRIAPYIPQAIRQSPTAQTTARVAEVLTPFTLPLTRGNIALNIAGGAAIGTGASALRRIGEDEGNPDVNYGAAAASVAMAGLLTAAAIRGVRTRQRYHEELGGSVVRPDITEGYTPPPDAYQATVGERLATAVMDRGVVLRNRLNEVDPSDASYNQWIVDSITSPHARAEQVIATLRTGVMPDGSRIESMRRMWDMMGEYRRTDPKVAAAIENAMAIDTEIDNRIRNLELGKTRKLSDQETAAFAQALETLRARNRNIPEWLVEEARQGKIGEPKATSFADLSLSELVRRLNDAERLDPRVRAYKGAWEKVARSLRDYLYRNGMITKAERDAFALRNPAWLPQIRQLDPDKSVIARRDITPGAGDPYNVSAVSAMERAVVDILDETLKNNAVRHAALSLRQWQLRQPPNAKKLVGRILNADDETKHPTISFRVAGRRVKLEVFNKEIADAVHKHPYLANEVWAQVNNSLRRYYQSATTGLIAAVAGSPFQLTSAAFSAAAAMINRPKGRYVGYLDRYAQKNFGIRVPADPTFAVQIASAIVRDTGAIIAREIGAAIERSLVTNGWFVRTFGQQNAAKMAQRAARIFERSMWHTQMLHGASNAGLAQTTDFSTTLRSALGFISPDARKTQPIGALIEGRKGAPTTARSITFDDAVKIMQEVGATVTPAYMRRTYNLLREFLDVVAGSPQSAFFAANYNPNMSRKERLALASDTRRIAGDPSVIGGNEVFLNLAVRPVPYANIAIQGVTRMGQAFRRDPVGTTFTAVYLASVPTLLSFASALLTDDQARERGEEPMAVKHMMNRPLREQVNTWIFYLPGVSPEQAIHIGIEPTIQPLTAVVSGLLPIFSGVAAEGIDLPQTKRARAAWSTIATDRLKELVETGLENAALQISPPPLLEAITRAVPPMLGEKAGFSLQEAITPFNPRVRGAAPSTTGLSRDQLPDDVTDRWVLESLRALLGVASEGFIEMARAFHFTTRDTGEAVEGARVAGEVYTTRLADRTRVFAPLWGVDSRVSTDTVVGREVRQALRKIDEVASGIADVNRPGTSGSGVTQIVSQTGGARIAIDDLEMRSFLQQVAQLKSAISIPEGQRKTLRDEITGVQQNGVLRPQEKRKIINDYMRQINDINKRLYADIRAFEQAMSRRYGRRIKLEDLDPTRGMDQFPSVIDAR